MTDSERVAEVGAALPDVDLARIMEVLPHRYPLLMVDRIENLVAFQTATGIKCVTASEPHFQGHFPEKPIMPGVLIIEAMAQTGAVLVVQSTDLDTKGKLVYFMSIDDARFRHPVVPGDVLRLEVKIVRNREKVWKFSGQAKVGATLCAEATYTAMIVDS